MKTYVHMLHGVILLYRSITKETLYSKYLGGVIENILRKKQKTRVYQPITGVCFADTKIEMAPTRGCVQK